MWEDSSWEGWDDRRGGRRRSRQGGYGGGGYGGGPRRHPGGHHGGRPPGWRGGPPPWIHEIVRHLAGPDVAAEFGAQFGPRRRHRVRRGDVRAAILDVLAGDEMNGYQVIQQISERTGGAWRPSPGSVYPTIQQLEDEGLVEGRELDGRRLLRLTDAGRSYVEQHPDEMAATWRPFEADDEQEQHEGDARAEVMPLASQVMGAMWQVMTTGTAQQRAEAAEILTETRRRLYELLAAGDDD